jgi:regulator of protease activity HflC (stomatin/prohibitin superfamily)
LLRLKSLTRSVRLALAGLIRRAAPKPTAGDDVPTSTLRPMRAIPGVAVRPVLLTLGAAAVAAGAGYLLVQHPPVQPLEPGQLAVRTNQLTGEVSVWREGPVWVLPGLHQLGTLSLQDRTWTAAAMAKANGPSPAQTVEGLSIGMDLRVRYAIDPARVGGAQALSYPKDIDGQLVEPAVQATVYKIVARHTVREIFSSQRAQIEQDIEAQIRERFKADGLLLRSVHIGQIDLPEDYRKGMEVLLTEGLSAEKMRYTLELREKQVK